MRQGTIEVQDGSLDVMCTNPSHFSIPFFPFLKWATHSCIASTFRVFKQAERAGAARLIILGSEEWSRGAVKVKDLKTREELEVPIGEMGWRFECLPLYPLGKTLQGQHPKMNTIRVDRWVILLIFDFSKKRSYFEWQLHRWMRYHTKIKTWEHNT